MKAIHVQIDDADEAQFTALVKAFRGGWLRASAVDLPEKLNYQEVLGEAQRDPAVSFKLKQRLAEDAGRDPLDALADAEMLHALAAKRFGELAPGGSAEDRRSAVTQGGAEALRRLFEVGQGHSGQSGRIARFLCGLYNGQRFPFDLTLLRGVDRSLFEDCLAVLEMDFLGQHEVHTFFSNGGRKWELMAQEWRVVDIERVTAMSKGLAERAVEVGQLSTAARELVAELAGGRPPG